MPRSSVDDVGDGAARVWYHIICEGTAEITPGAFTPFTLDSSNDAVLVSEAP